jgi:hypothetical protein
MFPKLVVSHRSFDEKFLFRRASWNTFCIVSPCWMLWLDYEHMSRAPTHSWKHDTREPYVFLTAIPLKSDILGIPRNFRSYRRRLKPTFDDAHQKIHISNSLTYAYQQFMPFSVQKLAIQVLKNEATGIEDFFFCFTVSYWIVSVKYTFATYNFTILFGRCSFQISAGVPSIVTDVFLVFPSSFKQVQG